MSTTAAFVYAKSFEEAMVEFRKEDGSVRWVLVGHENGEPSKIALVSTGSGDADELVTHLVNTEVQYCILKVPDTLYGAQVLKHVYIRWVGPQVPFSKVGRLGVVHGSIQRLFEPYHDCLETSQVADLSAAVMETRIRELSGTKSKVIEGDMDPSRRIDLFGRGTSRKLSTAKDTRQLQGSQALAPGKDALQVDEAAEAHIKEFKCDSSPHNWCLVKYSDKRCRGPLVFHARGTGGLDELKTSLTEDNVYYGILALSTMLDERVKARKFISVTVVGTTIPVMAKALIGTHRSVIENLIGSCHGMVFANHPSELSSRIVEQRLIASTSVQT